MAKVDECGPGCADAKGKKRVKVTEEVLVDLVLEDVMNGSQLFEMNPYHGQGGKFTSKEAAGAYASGAMAAGRAAGMKAKAAGKSREEVRAAIKKGMEAQSKSFAKAKTPGEQKDKKINAQANLTTRQHNQRVAREKAKMTAEDHARAKEFGPASRHLTKTYERLHQEAGKRIAPPHSPAADHWVRQHPDFKAAKERFDRASGR